MGRLTEIICLINAPKKNCLIKSQFYKIDTEKLEYKNFRKVKK